MLNIFNCGFSSQQDDVKQEETPSQEKMMITNQDSIINEMKVILGVIMKSTNSLEVITSPLIYTVVNSDGKEVRRCTLNEVDYSFVINQITEGTNLTRQFELNKKAVVLENIVLPQSISGYPFNVKGYLDCNELRLYEFHKNESSYIFIESTPMNWTGLMSAKFAFYQLVNVREKFGIQTIATPRCK